MLQATIENPPESHDIGFSFHDCPTLELFARSDAFMRGILGPFGSGKSSVCVLEIIQRGREQWKGPDGIRRSRWGVIRNTYAELRDTTIKTVFQWYPPHVCGRYVENKHTYRITCFPQTEIEIVFIALDRPEDIKKLLSLELTGAWVNEAREVPWAVIEALQGRVGRYPSKKDRGPRWSGVWLDTNPPDSDSAWYKYFEERNWLKDFEAMKRSGDLPADMQPNDFARIFSQPSGLSPKAENIPNLPGKRLYYARLGVGKSPEWKKVYIDGQYGFVVEGKLVYPEFSDQIHVKSVDPVPGRTIMRTWDFGLTPACVFSQELPDGRFLVFDEMVSDNMGIDQFSDDVIEKCNRSFRGEVDFDDIGDPAGQARVETDARSAFEIMQAKNINIRPARTNEIRLRQESVRKPLRTLTSGEPQFVLHPRCKVLRKGFLGGYHRRRIKVPGVERYDEKPVKNAFSHPHDALQYAALEVFAPALTESYDHEDDDFVDSGDLGYADDGRSDITGY